MRCFLSLIVVGFVALPVWAAPTVDGTLDGSYGAAIAVQGVQTQFGDANPPGVLNGSELDAAYASISGGRLYLMLTGNLEPNFNKLDVFFDSKAGGENTMTATPQYDYDPGAEGWNSPFMHGVIFDTGFTADYHLYARWGGGNNTGPFEVDFVNRNGGADTLVPGSNGKSPDNPTIGLIATGSIPAGNVAVYGPNSVMAPSSALTQNLDFAINDNNALGVTGGTAAADTNAAAAVTTGMEFSIALADLGNPAPGSTIKIAAVVNNSDHRYLSNQILGTFAAPQINLGGDGTGGFIGDLSGINFNNFAGNQYFTIQVPSAGVQGDYNGNGIVDAADYTIWRDHLGQTYALANRDTTNSGPINQADYTFWKSRFGAISGGGALGSGAVPEPASVALLTLGVLFGGRLIRRQS